MRILTTLGWNQFDYNEVTPEFDVGGVRVDYTLRTDGANRVFLEAKRAGELLDHHQEQLLRYAFSQGVELAILTNGLTWWLYLPMRQESWEQRRFCTIDTQREDVETATKHFIQFLSRPRVHDGSSVRDATELMDTLKRDAEIQKALPKAWESLIAKQDGLLIDLIEEEMQGLLGFRPGPESIHQFLAELAENLSSETRCHQATVQTDYSVSRRKHQATTGVTPFVSARSTGQRGRRGLTGFTFDGEYHAVNQWKGLLQTLAEVLYQRHPNEYDRVEDLRGSKRVYFSLSYEDLDEPREVRGSDYFIETKWGWKATVDQSHKLIGLFGYDDKDLEIDFI